VGSVLGSAGLALLCAAPRRDLRIAGLAAWAAGLGCLALYLLPDVSAAVLVAAAVAGLVVAVVGGWALLRWPYLLAFATLACLPARLPVRIGSEDANLLLPLYAVVAALAVAIGWQLLRGDERRRELGPVVWPLAAFVAWTGLTLLWTVDLREGAIFIGAFVLPFGLLALGFARLPWRGRWLTWLCVALVGTALLYATIGLYQWANRDIFWNPKVIFGNAYAPFFRVNSIFWDPSIYGRYLAVGILTALAGILLGGVRGFRLAGLYAVVVAMWVGLFFSFSQSSFAALATGVVVAALVLWGRRAALAVAVLAVLFSVGALAIPHVRDRIDTKSRSGLDSITSDRSTLVGQGVRIALDRPVGGVGAGGFKRAYADRVGLKGKRPKTAASHTTPVTVAAEEGIPGLLLFVWLVAAAVLGTLRGLGHGFTSRVSFAVGLTLVAITVHSLFYNALFEDPMTWALFGLVGLAASVPRKGSAANGGER
jgi:O-antigen ligase